MLLPRLLKRARPSLRIGFFLHTPFPSYDIIRCHPNREELLTGVLGADLVGFHTFGYLRHFRSAVLRVLDVETEMTAIRHDGHTSALGVFPIGISVRRFEEELRGPRFRDQRTATAAAHAGKRVILSVERLDYTKGIVRRLDAIELFLSRLSGQERDAVRFVFISVPTRTGVDEYRKLRETVEHQIGRINGRYATLNNSPIHFLHQSVGLPELCALYVRADVALVTPLVDGMNLVAKEFIACQGDGLFCAAAAAPAADEECRAGVLVLSEFAGAAQELPDAVTVNPFDVPAVADAIAHALAMPANERRRRMIRMRDRVREYDAAAWAGDFVADLAARPPSHPPCANGVGDARRDLAAAIAGGKRVALFLDYDGTLREVVRDPAAAVPTPEVIALLERLCSPGLVDVTVVSGRRADDLSAFLGKVDALGLVAEHGAEVRTPGSREWQQLDHNLDFAWKDQVRQILQLYQRSTPGTHVEEKRTGLVWHYRRADPEFGKWKAKQLVDELSIVAANHPVEVRHGRKIVEVSSTHFNKGAAVLRLIADRQYDLILAAGDDTTDESMFALATQDARIVSVRIGDGETLARHRLPSPASFRQFLNGAFSLGSQSEAH
jgi:trehalose 6-phosphate synthase/phosphatase